MSGVLNGIRVIEWAEVLAGPEATAMLADMGAEVIKLELPGCGDLSRGLLRIDRNILELPGGKSTIFESNNRGKKSLTLDLRKEKGQQALYRLVRKCDVFFTSFHRVVEKYHADYATLSQYNPRLIYGLVTPYGLKGPDSGKAGYDPQALARSGVMDTIADPPQIVQYAMVDEVTAILASHAVVSALLARERYGVGQLVSVSLLSGGMNLIYGNVAAALLTGRDTIKHDRTNTHNPLRNYYQCADGRWLVGAHTPPDRYWPSFCKALGIEELETDSRFENAARRAENALELISILDRIFATKSCPEWLEVFQNYRDLSFVPVNKCTDLVNDAQVIANNYIVDMDHPTLGRVKLPSFPIHFSENPARPPSPAPELGQHTEEVLLELGDYSWDEITQLRDEEVI